MVRKLVLIGLALLAARMARRAMRREAEVISLLWTLIQITAGGLSVPPAISNTAKTRGLEDRVNNIIPYLINPQATPAAASDGTSTASDGTSASGNSSYGPSNSSAQSGNSSYDMSAGTQVTDNTQGSGNDGGNNSTTSGSSPGPVNHTHSMTHYHVSSSDLSAMVNATRDAYSGTVSAYNNHITDHGNLVNTVAALRSSYSSTVTTLNTLQSSHSNLVSAYNVLKTSHSNLVAAHNTVLTKLNNANVLQ